MAGADFAANPSLEAIFETNEATLAKAAGLIEQYAGRKSFSKP